MKVINLIANIVWLVFGGLALSLSWLLLGVVLCITIIGIPFGRQCFKFARLSLFPFGKTIRSDFGSHPVMNTIWAILFGWVMALGYLAAGIANCITIIGIPSGLQSFKFMKLAFIPFGASVRKK